MLRFRAAFSDRFDVVPIGKSLLNSPLLVTESETPPHLPLFNSPFEFSGRVRRLFLQVEQRGSDSFCVYKINSPPDEFTLIKTTNGKVARPGPTGPDAAALVYCITVVFVEAALFSFRQTKLEIGAQTPGHGPLRVKRSKVIIYTLVWCRSY